MRSTFFFISMLIFVSSINAKIDSLEVDPALLEINKAPESEAVFATMAIHLETKGGFQQVLRLLNDLVHDSKEQLHSITKVWRGVNARCQVSKIKLHGRQEFFDTYLAQARRHVAQYTHRLAEVQDHLAGFRKSEVVYGGLLKTEIARHHAQAKVFHSKYRHAQRGIESIKLASRSVSDWTPKGRALVQTHLMEASKHYLEVHQMELPNITGLLERTTDNKVRRRILEWLGRVVAQLSSSSEDFRRRSEKLAAIGKKVENSLAQMLVALSHGVKHLHKAITYSAHMIKAGRAGVNFFSKLIKENRGLIQANNSYCSTESKNYNAAKINATNSIKMFVSIRAYFLKHYQKIHSYIKAKYHRY